MEVTYKKTFLSLIAFSSLVIVTSFYMGGLHAEREAAEVKVTAHSTSMSNSSSSDTRPSFIKGRGKTRVSFPSRAFNKCLHELKPGSQINKCRRAACQMSLFSHFRAASGRRHSQSGGGITLFRRCQLAAEILSLS